MKQTKIESIVERTADIGTGYIISVMVYEYYIMPSIKIMPSTYVVAIFTIISFVRGYFWRRFFNRGLHKAVHKFLKRKHYGSID